MTFSNDSDQVRSANYAGFLVKTDRWTEQMETFRRENDGGNPHRQRLPAYLAMLPVFNPMWLKDHTRGLQPGPTFRQ